MISSSPNPISTLAISLPPQFPIGRHGGLGEAVTSPSTRSCFQAGRSQGPPLATWLRSKAQRWAKSAQLLGHQFAHKSALPGKFHYHQPTPKMPGAARLDPSGHPISEEVDPLIVQRQRRTLGLSRRAACPQTLDQLSCLTANSADDRASPLPATLKRPSQSKPAKLPA